MLKFSPEFQFKVYKINTSIYERYYLYLLSVISYRKKLLNREGYPSTYCHNRLLGNFSRTTNSTVICNRLEKLAEVNRLSR